MPQTSYGDISPRTAAYADRNLLTRAQPFLTIDKFCQTRPIPKGETNAIKFRRYEALALALVALVEGVTPSGKKMTHTDITATLAQYGDLIQITDLIEDTHKDPVLKEATNILGEQAAQTLETIKFNILKAGTNVFYSNGALRTSVNTPVTRTIVRAVTKALQRQNARMLTQVLKSSPKYDTHNVEPAYFAVGHPDLESDIRDMTGFIPSSQYGSEAPMENEIGAVEHVRFIKSTIFTPFASGGGAKGAMESTDGVNADVYPILVFGRDAAATVPFQGKGAVQTMVVNRKPSDSDPMAQRTKVSWKAYLTAAILNDLWMARIECAATA